MAQKFLSIKNFEKYQHFKKANPPWVKLYRSLLTDREFIRLPTSCKYLYIGLITLASEGCNRVPNDIHFISHRLAMNHSEIDLKPLYKAGFLIASESTIYRETISQRRDREETETETEPLARLEEFEVFWEYYPRKVGKKDAHKAWEKAKDRPPLPDILSALAAQKSSEQWTKDNGQFIPHPATWLNQGRWADSHVIEFPKSKPVLVGPKAYQPAPIIDESKVEPCPPELVETMRRLGVTV